MLQANSVFMVHLFSTSQGAQCQIDMASDCVAQSFSKPKRERVSDYTERVQNGVERVPDRGGGVDPEGKLLQHESWLEKAESSEDARTRELFRIQKHVKLSDHQWHFIWWMATQTMKHPGYSMTSQEVHFRIKELRGGQELSRLLETNWEIKPLSKTEKAAARKIALNVRKQLKVFYDGGLEKPHGVQIDLPKHWQNAEGADVTASDDGYILVFVFSAEKAVLPRAKGSDVLRPSEKIWQRLLSPIGPAKGMLIYSNEQPELDEQISKLGAYSGTGEVAAALMIGLRTAHLNCKITPYRSQKFDFKLFREKPAWFVFLGSPVSNRPMQIMRGESNWSDLQKFTFEEPKQVGEPCALKKIDGSWRRPFEPAGHNPQQEYALITYLHHGNQVIVAFSGMTTVGTWVAADYFSDDAKIKELLSRLKVKENEPIPSFEVVLKFCVVDGMDGEAVIVNSAKVLS